MIVKIPEDIYAYENKTVGNFTTRQVVCGLLGFLLIAPTFFFLYWFTGSMELAAFASFLVSSPVFFAAVYKNRGQHLEQVLEYKLVWRFQYPRKRKFVMSNLYEDVERLQKEWEAYEENANAGAPAAKKKK